MKLGLMCIGLMLGAVASAQVALRQEVFYDFTSHTSQAVVSTPLGKLTGILGNTQSFVNAKQSFVDAGVTDPAPVIPDAPVE